MFMGYSKAAFYGYIPAKILRSSRGTFSSLAHRLGWWSSSNGMDLSKDVETICEGQ